VPVPRPGQDFEVLITTNLWHGETLSTLRNSATDDAATLCSGATEDGSSSDLSLGGALAWRRQGCVLVRKAGNVLPASRWQDAGSTLNRRSALQPLPWELKFGRNALNHEPAF
jgi:hypothetical protein